MSVSRQKKAQSLVAAVNAHASDFYRTQWGNERQFERLPPMSRDILRTVPLSRRRYQEATGLVKIIRDDTGSFLSEWSFGDIGREMYGAQTERPFAYFTDAHETLEKALWCELRGMPGFAAERDTNVAITAAVAFRADSLLTDPRAFERIRPLLRSLPEKLRSLTVLGDALGFPDTDPYSEYADEVRLVLALPETGVIASSSPGRFPRFTPCEDCIIEPGPESLVTKLSLLVTPIIRYQFDGGRLTFS